MKGFFKTVAIVTVFSICEKFLGFLYRIFMSQTIGAEGIGIYQVALSVFALLLTVTCSGTPITVSRLMTKYNAENNPKKAQTVISAGLFITLIISLPITLLFFIFKNHLGLIFTDSRSITIFLIVLPTLVLNSLYSVFRGVFWGNKDFLSYSIIELLEEVCMIIVGVILILFSSDFYVGTVYSGIAVAVSYVFSFSLATIVFFIRKNKLVNPKSELKPLISSAAPITAMRTVNSLAISLVSIILPLRLVSAGYTNAQALSAFGSACGQAIPILFIPTTLTGSFTLVLVPEIAENFYKKQNDVLKDNIEKALKFTTLLSCLFIPVFAICGEEIGIIIFGSHECGKYLTVSSFLMLFMGISNISTSILNSIGFEKRTLIYFIISSVFMLLAIWFLPFVMGIYSLLVGFTFVYGLTSLLNLILLNKVCVEKPKYLKHLITCCVLIIPSGVSGIMLEKMLLPVLGTVLTFFVSAIFMFAFSLTECFAFNLIDFKLIKQKINLKSFSDILRKTKLKFNKIFKLKRRSD